MANKVTLVVQERRVPAKRKLKTHSFAMSESSMNFISTYAERHGLSVSSALRELLVIAKEKLRQDHDTIFLAPNKVEVTEDES